MDLFNDIANEHTTILTANRRLAEHIIQQFEKTQLKKEKKSWKSIDCFPMDTWLATAFHEFSAITCDACRLLTPFQEIKGWEKIIKLQSPDLLDCHQTALLAKEAWYLLHQWQISLEHSGLGLTDNSRLFLSWARAWKKQCYTAAWIDMASAMTVLIEAIQNKIMTLPRHLLLAGFIVLPPQYEALFAACRAQGCTIQYVKNPVHENKLQKISFSEAETEIKTIARFAKELIQKDSQMTLTCVFPTINTDRHKIKSIFSDFLPDNLFNISGSPGLQEQPLVYTALQCLTLLRAPYALSTLNHLLRSPFLGEADTELLGRAILNKALHDQNNKMITPKNLKHMLSKYSTHLAKRFSHFMLHVPPKKEMPSVWAQIFSNALNELGWPGERTLSSHEYQALQRWYALLDEFAGLDAILQPFSLSQAQQVITQLCQQTAFQPKSNNAPIQILGVLEAIDVPCDILWFARLEDTTWPSSAKPNPFIPYVLQRDYQMPHASADRELQYCRLLIERLKQAKKVIYSYPTSLNDQPVGVSPLIRSLPLNSIEEFALEKNFSLMEQIYLSRDCEFFSDDTAPVMRSNEKIRGGTHILKNQAACPFRAFAEHRLHATAFTEPTVGLDVKEKGTLIHKTLELFWADLRNQNQLLMLSADRLHEKINIAIEEALLPFQKKYPQHLKFLTVEKNRLFNLLCRWIEIEKNRPPFQVVGREKIASLVLGHLTLDMCIDRVDVLEDGSVFFIDYKTSETHVRDWFGDRVSEPQLPLYVLTHETENSSIGFLQIHPNEFCFKGVSAKDQGISGIQPIEACQYTDARDWPSQLNQWSIQLTKLSDHFCQGDARVDPKNQQTCDHCHLQALCRVKEEII